MELIKKTEQKEIKNLILELIYFYMKSVGQSNADEEIVVSDIEIDGDSITIRMPVFEGVLKGVFTETKISGDFIQKLLSR